MSAADDLVPASYVDVTVTVDLDLASRVARFVVGVAPAVWEWRSESDGDRAVDLVLDALTDHLADITAELDGGVDVAEAEAHLLHTQRRLADLLAAAAARVVDAERRLALARAREVGGGEGSTS